MADIFISYSKTDHALALKLSAFLEAEGWSVWWDKSLGAADLYRDEIMKQLATARAVITIWTPNSIKSDWVRAEAGAAKAQGKLIPAKTSDVAYADIPLPFGEMHTENVGSTDLIRAAVVAQLAKPKVEPSAVALLTKGFKYELLTWWGIIGGAITLFVAISTTLKLADWAKVLVEHWKEWTHAFWVWAFGWLGIHLPPEWTPVLSFLLFGLLLAIGQAVKFSRRIKPQTVEDMYQGRSFQFISWRPFLCLVLMFFIGSGLLFFAHDFALQFRLATLFPDFETQIMSPGPISCFVLAFAISIPVMLFAMQTLHAFVTSILLVIFWTIVTAVHLPNPSSDLAVLTTFTTLPFLSVLLLLVAPAKAVSRRLIFLALGLLLLIGLNELSKLGIDVTAPKVQG
jgi:TIR domain